MKKVVAMGLILVMVLGCLCGCSSKKDVQLKDYVKEMDYHDGFTILQLTDIHWNGSTQIGDEEYGSERYLQKVFDETVKHAGKIDLIEITGDTFMLSNSRAVESFIDFMTKNEIPYAMVWGNHDRESTYNPNWFSEKFMNAPYSMYTEVDGDDVHERSNYVIELKDGGKTVWQIFQLDSGASYRDGAFQFGMTYDYIRDDQYEWMTKMHSAVSGNVPALCYYHIVQSEAQKTWDAIRNGAEGYKSKFFKLEGLAASKYAGTTEEVFKNNNVKGAFMGHDHGNDWTYTTPDGVTYGFGVKTGTELYRKYVTKDYEGSGVEISEDFELIGASLVTLNDTLGNFKLEHLYLNERDEGDFVMWVEY